MRMQPTHPLSIKLLQLMQDKQTNLALSADVTDSDSLLTLADKLGPEIAVFKTHMDIIKDFSFDLTKKLTSLAKKHRFLIFEDRKFADIGSTVQKQYASGTHRIVEWADIINAHILTGEGIIEGLKEIGLPKERGLLLIAQISSSGHYFTEHYTQAAIDLAKQHKDFVMGFIAQEHFKQAPEFIVMTPGVKLTQGTDALKQQYNTPAHVIRNKECDIIIVGRGIYQATDPVAAAREYRRAGWEAYQ